MLDDQDSRFTDDRPNDLPGLNLTTVEIPTRSFLGIGKPNHLVETLRLRLTDQCYLPKVADAKKDWIARVAHPAFEAYCQRRPEAARQLKRFCSIGTGAGLDALVAMEVLQPALIAITDLHRDVVDQAMVNILANLKRPDSLVLRSGVGDLLSPFDEGQMGFDLIYENLPNIPLPAEISLDEGQASSSFIAPRQEVIPPLVRSYLLELHFAFLLQARRFLTPQGAVLCSIGGRLPLQAMVQTFEAAGFQAEVLLYSWKIQSEPEEVITGYAQQHEHGYGPFYFYRAKDLEDFFAGREPAANNSQAEDLERQLEGQRVDAPTALKLHRAGEVIAHSVVVLEGRASTPAL